MQAGGHEFESHHLHVSHEFDVMNCFSEPIANVFANRVREAIHRSSNDDREREMPRISSATAKSVVTSLYLENFILKNDSIESMRLFIQSRHPEM